MKETDFLKLKKQDKNDNVDIWHVAENSSKNKLDDWAKNLDQHLTDTPQDYSGLTGGTSSLETWINNTNGFITNTNNELDQIFDSSNNFIYENLIRKNNDKLLLENQFIRASTRREGYTDGSLLGFTNYADNDRKLQINFNGPSGGNDNVFINGHGYRFTRQTGNVQLDYQGPYVIYWVDEFSTGAIDTQLTRYGTISNPSNKGDKYIYIDGIGNADVGLNDWQPKAGEIIYVGFHVYKIKTVFTDQLEIENPLREDISSASGYIIYDLKQPYLAVLGYNPSTNHAWEYYYHKYNYNNAIPYSTAEITGNGINDVSHESITEGYYKASQFKNNVSVYSHYKVTYSDFTEGDIYTIFTGKNFRFIKNVEVFMALFPDDSRTLHPTIMGEPYVKFQVRNAAGDGTVEITEPMFRWTLSNSGNTLGLRASDNLYWSETQCNVYVGNTSLINSSIVSRDLVVVVHY